MKNLDHYLSSTIRSQIEQQYYARINAQAQLDQLAADPDFITRPETHVAFFSDHGVVHVRDVAQQVLQILDAINGVLIPARQSSQLSFMKGYGVMLAYLHDIGMVDFSHFGRAMHPEFAAQSVFKAQFDELFQILWDENCGNIAWRLLNLANRDLLVQDPQVVLRELLAMAICHSKSKVPIAVVNDCEWLRRTLQISISTPLPQLYQQQQASSYQTLSEAGLSNEAPLTPELAWLDRYYGNFKQESFAWLVSRDSEVRSLVADVIDTLRVLRCADALRQRGTALKTSGGYQIFVDRRTANAIHAFKKDGGDEVLLLLETDDPIAAGEANVASSELTESGDLRISFHRGAFDIAEAVQHAVHCAATVINDIQTDVIGSFQGVTTLSNRPLKSYRDIQILLEGADDNPDFAKRVYQKLVSLNPNLASRSRPVPSLQNMSAAERERYLYGIDLDWDLDEKTRILCKIGTSGHNIEGIDPAQAFEDVRLISAEAGEILIEAASPPAFIYIPLSTGLKCSPLGGYRPFFVNPWTPLGNTSVIRGAMRNATIVVEAPLLLLTIPKEIYLKAWHSTYTKAEFGKIVSKIYGD